MTIQSGAAIERTSSRIRGDGLLRETKAAANKSCNDVPATCNLPWQKILANPSLQQRLRTAAHGFQKIGNLLELKQSRLQRISWRGVSPFSVFSCVTQLQGRRWCVAGAAASDYEIRFTLCLARSVSYSFKSWSPLSNLLRLEDVIPVIASQQDDHCEQNFFFKLFLPEILLIFFLSQIALACHHNKKTNRESSVIERGFDFHDVSFSIFFFQSQ